MKPATDPKTDYKLLVKAGYDSCARAYMKARENGPLHLEPLLGLLAPSSRVLDLGCGCGVPVAKALAANHSVIGVDFSQGQLALARAQVPGAEFIEADISAVHFSPSSFDAVVALWVIFHLPRAEQLDVLRSIATWLKPGGYLLATLSKWNEEPYTEDFLGVEMFWTNFAFDEYVGYLSQLGFEVLDTSTLAHGFDDSYPPEEHPLVFARKPLAHG